MFYECNRLVRRVCVCDDGGMVTLAQMLVEQTKPVDKAKPREWSGADAEYIGGCVATAVMRLQWKEPTFEQLRAACDEAVKRAILQIVDPLPPSPVEDRWQALTGA